MHAGCHSSFKYLWRFTTEIYVWMMEQWSIKWNKGHALAWTTGDANENILDKLWSLCSQIAAKPLFHSWPNSVRIISEHSMVNVLLNYRKKMKTQRGLMYRSMVQLVLHIVMRLWGSYECVTGKNERITCRRLMFWRSWCTAIAMFASRRSMTGWKRSPFQKVHMQVTHVSISLW